MTIVIYTIGPLAARSPEATPARLEDRPRGGFESVYHPLSMGTRGLSLAAASRSTEDNNLRSTPEVDVQELER
jgi:hypothetical protein